MALAALRGEEVAAAPIGAARFELVETRAGLDVLAEPWKALALRAARPQQGFQSFAWLRSWARHYCDDGHALNIVLGWMGGELALIWPLGARRRLGLTILGFLGEPLCQYHDVLVVDGEVGDRLLADGLDFIRRLPYDALNLRRVRGNSGSPRRYARRGRA